MSTYLIAILEVTDIQGYARYGADSAESLEKYDVEVLAVSDAPLVIEGTLPAQHVVLLRFRDRQSMMNWYHSPEYGRARAIREVSAATNFLIGIEGFDKPV